jgi:predicted DNA-binding transcriptional regulator YafY
MDGYFLPPLNFTADEALMLILGSDFMAQNFDAQYRQAAETASAKIEAVLPDRLRVDMDYLRHNINFFASRPPIGQDDLEPLKQLRRAIIERRRVRLQYAKRFGPDGAEEKSTRDVDPYSLARLSMDWYLLAYCHLRQGFRVFRLARIDGLTVLSQTFARSPAFKPDWLNPSGAQNIIVRALFKPEATRWVRESHSYTMLEAEEVADGLLVTLFVRDEREMLQWLLGWGGNVRVLEPESLCQLLLDEARRVIDLYK